MSDGKDPAALLAEAAHSGDWWRGSTREEMISAMAAAIRNSDVYKALLGMEKPASGSQLASTMSAEALESGAKFEVLASDPKPASTWEKLLVGDETLERVNYHSRAFNRPDTTHTIFLLREQCDALDAMRAGRDEYLQNATFLSQQIGKQKEYTDCLEKERDALRAERNAALAKVKELEAKLDALQKPKPSSRVPLTSNCPANTVVECVESGDNGPGGKVVLGSHYTTDETLGDSTRVGGMSTWWQNSRFVVISRPDQPKPVPLDIEKLAGELAEWIMKVPPYHDCKHDILTYLRAHPIAAPDADAMRAERDAYELHSNNAFKTLEAAGIKPDIENSLSAAISLLVSERDAAVKKYEGWSKAAEEHYSERLEAETARDAAVARVKELEANFKLQWDAGQRATKRWQAATGRTLCWPDHAELCVWLMAQLTELEAKLAALQKPKPPSQFAEKLADAKTAIERAGAVEHSFAFEAFKALLAAFEAGMDGAK